MLTPVIVIQLSALRVSFLSTFVLGPAATLGVDLVAVATGLTMLILAFCGWRRTGTGCIGSSSAGAARRRRCTGARSAQGAPRPKDGERLIEDVFSAAGNQTVLPFTHPSEGVDRVNRVVSMAADEMTGWEIQT